MNRRVLLALGVLAAATPTLAAGGAIAQSSTAADKAVVDQAKSAGVVGEQGDGFLGFVTSAADDKVKAAVANINAGRSQAYRDIAAKSGVTGVAAGEATAQQLIARLPAGQYYRPLGGAWTRKP